jgi:hypothetical protein
LIGIAISDLNVQTINKINSCLEGSPYLFPSDKPGKERLKEIA